MAPPTGSDGLARAVEFVLPSVGVVTVVSLTKEVYGGLAAGLIYLVLTGAILGGIYFSAKYWNTIYAAGFVVSAVVLWVMVPGVIGEIVHPVFGVLGQLLTLGFLVLMVILLARKIGLDDL
ncbi:hypothetical protein [Haloarcula amylolytica]|jgi:hypothetical protein|uniref:hypothetical protein n=1 Tax=Haloarcula amylolytica TaxID=396317 RepID=UPI001266EDCB|nr:hypothetical protein [Haloarcula amylolytica]